MSNLQFVYTQGENSMNIYIGPIEGFYIAGSIMLLAVAIIVYPTLRYGSRKKSSKGKSR